MTVGHAGRFRQEPLQGSALIVPEDPSVPTYIDFEKVLKNVRGVVSDFNLNILNAKGRQKYFENGIFSILDEPGKFHEASKVFNNVYEFYDYLSNFNDDPDVVNVLNQIEFLDNNFSGSVKSVNQVLTLESLVIQRNPFGRSRYSYEQRALASAQILRVLKFMMDGSIRDTRVNFNNILSGGVADSHESERGYVLDRILTSK